MLDMRIQQRTEAEYSPETRIRNYIPPEITLHLSISSFVLQKTSSAAPHTIKRPVSERPISTDLKLREIPDRNGRPLKSPSFSSSFHWLCSSIPLLYFTVNACLHYDNTIVPFATSCHSSVTHFTWTCCISYLLLGTCLKAAETCPCVTLHWYWCGFFGQLVLVFLYFYNYIQRFSARLMQTEAESSVSCTSWSVVVVAPKNLLWFRGPPKN
jgi:hypothetical protein